MMLGIDSLDVINMVRAMRHLASVDGFSDAEMELISGFYAGAKGESDPSFDEVFNNEKEWDDSELSVVDTDEHKEAFLQTCMFLIFADGKVTEEEKVVIKRWASTLQVSDEKLQEYFNFVKENFLEGLRNIPQPPANLAEIEASFTL